MHATDHPDAPARFSGLRAGPRAPSRRAWLVLALVAFSTLAGLAGPQPTPGPPGRRFLEPHRLLEKARLANPERYRHSMENGVRIGHTRDGRTFWLLWCPAGARSPAAGTPVVATLHGHASYAFDELFLWHRFAAERGMAILALQWWGGVGELPQDYLAPHEIYRAVDDAFRELGVGPGRVILHGFSRGSTNVCAVAAIDRHVRRNYFSVVIANAGKPGSDFPPNVAIDRGDFGDRPLAGPAWVLYCGEKDPNPQRDGCEGMALAAGWIRHHGGDIALFIRDPDGDHGGFHRNPSNVRRALDVFMRPGR